MAWIIIQFLTDKMKPVMLNWNLNKTFKDGIGIKPISKVNEVCTF